MYTSFCPFRAERPDSPGQLNKPSTSTNYEQSTQQKKKKTANHNQEIHECIHEWDLQNRRCRALARDIEVTALVDPDLCRDCYCKREEHICDEYDTKIRRCRKWIECQKAYLRELDRDEAAYSVTVSLLARNEEQLRELKARRGESLRMFRDSQGVWVGSCRAISFFFFFSGRLAGLTVFRSRRGFLRSILCCFTFLDFEDANSRFPRAMAELVRLGGVRVGGGWFVLEC